MLALTRKLQPVGPGRKRTRPVKKVAAPPVPVVKAAPLTVPVRTRRLPAAVERPSAIMKAKASTLIDI